MPHYVFLYLPTLSLCWQIQKYIIWHNNISHASAPVPPQVSQPKRQPTAIRCIYHRKHLPRHHNQHLYCRQYRGDHHLPPLTGTDEGRNSTEFFFGGFLMFWLYFLLYGTRHVYQGQAVQLFFLRLYFFKSQTLSFSFFPLLFLPWILSHDFFVIRCNTVLFYLCRHSSKYIYNNTYTIY